MKRFACLAIPFAVAACGDNKTNGTVDAPTPIDSADIDTPTPIDAAVDAPTDAPIDAPAGPDYSGTISVIEARLKNMGGAGVDGHGIQVGVSFINNATAVAPIDMTAGATSTSGCFVWRYAAADLPGLIGTNQGAVQISTPSDGAPSFPACIFNPAVGYVCPDTGSSGMGGTLTMMSAATSTFTITGGTATFGDEDIGRYLKLGATGVPALDAANLPIVARVSATTVVVAGIGTSLTLPAAATFTTFAGVGPVPDLAAGTPRNFMDDADAITATKVGTNPQVDDFANQALLVGGSTVGDDFTLGTGMSASTPMIAKVLPTTIPTDGSEFVIGCDSAAACGTSAGSLVNIVTSNAPTYSSPFDFPGTFGTTVPTRTQIRCVSLSSNEVRVPAAISAHLRASESGATKIQVTFIRANFKPIADSNAPTATTNFLGGHAEVGFKTVP